MGVHDERDKQGLSRRDVLKRAAVAGVVAWSAPVISSLRTPAFAQYGGCEAPSCNFGEPCDCGACAARPVLDPCLCSALGFCTSDTPVCQTDADCEAHFFGVPGSRCVPCGFDPVCCRSSCWNPCDDGGEGAQIGDVPSNVRVIRP
jgi:hypothetical protein